MSSIRKLFNEIQNDYTLVNHVLYLKEAKEIIATGTEVYFSNGLLYMRREARK